MPRQPLFKSEPVQSIVVGVVMGAILVGSLGLAYAFTIARQEPWSVAHDRNITTTLFHLGHLELQIPESFEPIASPDLTNNLDTWALFQDHESTRRLFVAALAPARPRAPLVVLNQTLNAVVAKQSLRDIQQWQQVVNFRTGTLTGAWYAGVSPSESGDQLHLIAVLTEDARRYWAVYLTHLVEQRSLILEAMNANRRLMGMILSTATSRNFRDAQEEDLLIAGLPAPTKQVTGNSTLWPPDGLHAKVPLDSHGEEPLILIPEDTHARVRTLRVRGTIDSNASDPNHPLSPNAQLINQFHQLTGRTPRSDEIQTGEIDGIPAWRISLVHRNASLVQEVWYTKIDENRGLLIEVLSEPEAFTRTSKWSRHDSGFGHTGNAVAARHNRHTFYHR